ncbi:hypothetical protein VK70_21090 [Paenibacillus durus ATCC 35681]|uniref:Uncharacterized protein n=1 Tax=Paenibacillus durus ATCC 35681 TaxID=1333534 RepID=A0A0F7FD01_PAEDU|nr:hypothetical protein VK70_21090 [Paenibacillus durus ATCC 35681]
MKYNNVMSTAFHICLLIFVVFMIINSDKVSNTFFSNQGSIIFYVVLNLLYFIFGFIFGIDSGKALGNLFSYSLISMIGIVIWFFCLLNYISYHDSPSFLGPEFIWILSAGYNFSSYYIFKLISNEWNNEGVVLVILLLLNFYQSLLLWLGLETRKRLKAFLK